ncbi:MAG: hypothetical protein WBK77_10745 [Alphaproteobacteria bacterium]
MIVTACMGAFSPADAEQISEMTEENIRDFIEKTMSIAKGGNSDIPESEIDSFLEAHIHPDARFKSKINYAVPGFDAQQTSMSIGKGDFIANVHKAESTVSNYESQIEISDIKISTDRTKATLKTRTMESGIMPVSDNIEQENVPMEGMSTCTQMLMLSNTGDIQMFHADCTTDVQFKTFDP